MAFAEIIKSVASLLWPVAFLVVILSFKPEILGLLTSSVRRKLRLEGFGFKVELDPAEQQKAAAIANAGAEPGTIELKEISGFVRTRAMAKLEKEIHSSLQKLQGVGQTDYLVRSLAEAQLRAAFGLIYAIIFGSQIAALIELGARRRMPNSEVHAFYADANNRSPATFENYGFSGWLSFMFQSLLLTQEGDEVVITDIGDDFLLWMRALKLSINRPG